MVTPTREQLRGHCQACGRQQAVTRGRVAKHAYTVKHYHFFNGVCFGAGHPPLEFERMVTDDIVARVRAELDEVRVQLAQLRDGTLVPRLADGRERNPDYWKLREERYKQIPFETADPEAQKAAVKKAINIAEERIKSGEYLITELLILIDEVYVKRRPLTKVQVQAGPTIHLVGGYGVLCAVSRMGAYRKTNRVDDVAKANCPKCLAARASRVKRGLEQP